MSQLSFREVLQIRLDTYSERLKSLEKGCDSPQASPSYNYFEGYCTALEDALSAYDKLQKEEGVK